MPRQCVTHHDACDCREARVRALVEAATDALPYLRHAIARSERDALVAALAALASPPPSEACGCVCGLTGNPPCDKFSDPPSPPRKHCWVCGHRAACHVRPAGEGA